MVETPVEDQRSRKRSPPKRHEVGIFLEHVRSFSQQCCIHLRPLTLLVGENSSGKSTFLSVVSSVFDARGFPGSPGFNEPPYHLGTFDSIVTYRGGRYGRDERFSIGFSVGKQGSSQYRKAIATYGSDYGNVVLKRFETLSAQGSLSLSLSTNALSGKLLLSSDSQEGSEPIEFQQHLPRGSLLGQPTLALQIMDSIATFEGAHRRSQDTSARPTVDRVWAILQAAQPPYPSSSSFAPIRSEPQRTYDEFREEYSPEGDHIPMLLARLLRQESTSEDSRRLHESLVRFGADSGLFTKIAVKRLGRKVSDPFQIQVGVAGPAFNLADVGYGVSQALPIVVQSVLRATSRVFLMQQPEIHLHPRAQAALGSFFADLVEHGNETFLIETHSDYLVDRIRQEVARGKISPDKVLILFFHKPKLETSVYPITLDSNGNVEEAPAEYRSFFLQEELNLFNRTSA